MRSSASFAQRSAIHDSADPPSGPPHHPHHHHYHQHPLDARPTRSPNGTPYSQPQHPPAPPTAAAAAAALTLARACRACWPHRVSTPHAPDPLCASVRLRNCFSYPKPVGNIPSRSLSKARHPLDPGALVTVVLWPPAARPQAQRWVFVRPPPDLATFSHGFYLPCGFGSQCKFGVFCTRAHSDPPDAEIAYWNLVQPLHTHHRQHHHQQYEQRRRHSQPNTTATVTATPHRVSPPSQNPAGFQCSICKLVTSSYAQLVQHTSQHQVSESFTADLDWEQLLAPISSMSTASTASNPSPTPVPTLATPTALPPLAPPRRRCGLCNVVANSQQQLDQHVQGLRHRTYAEFHGVAPETTVLPQTSAPPTAQSAAPESPPRDAVSMDSCLVAAVMHGDLAVVRTSLVRGASTSAMLHSQPVLHLAVLHQRTEIALFLLGWGCSLTETDGDGNTALHLLFDPRLADAVALRASLLRAFLLHHRDINVRNRGGQTALHLCALEGQDVEAAELLLTAGADPQLADHSGATPLALALWRASFTTVPAGGRAAEMALLLQSWQPASNAAPPPALMELPPLLPPTLPRRPSSHETRGYQVEPRFRPLLGALACFPEGASVELWRLSGLIKPVVTQLGISRKDYVTQAADAGYITVHYTPHQRQLYVRVAAAWRDYVVEFGPVLLAVQPEAEGSAAAGALVEDTAGLLGGW